MFLTHVMSLPRQLLAPHGRISAVLRWFATVHDVFAEVREMRRAANARYPFAED
jgi:hypothetical protein